MKCQSELVVLQAMLRDFVQTLPPSVQTLVMNQADIALKNINTALNPVEEPKE